MNRDELVEQATRIAGPFCGKNDVLRTAVALAIVVLADSWCDGRTFEITVLDQYQNQIQN